MAPAEDLRALQPWLEAQPFFLLGSANAAGDCDCSYRGRQTEGGAEPLLRVEGGTRLVFPDYPGNNLFNTIGNLLEHPALACCMPAMAQPTGTAPDTARLDYRLQPRQIAPGTLSP